jgi:hypothetical protein
MDHHYLGLDPGPGGVRGCLLEAVPHGREPRPLYLELTGGASPLAPTMQFLTVLGQRPILALAGSLPPDVLKFPTGGLHDAELQVRDLDTILGLADQLLGRAFHRAHLAAWLTWRAQLYAYPPDDLRDEPEETAWRWIRHLAALRGDIPF